MKLEYQLWVCLEGNNGRFHWEMVGFYASSEEAYEDFDLTYPSDYRLRVVQIQTCK